LSPRARPWLGYGACGRLLKMPDGGQAPVRPRAPAPIRPVAHPRTTRPALAQGTCRRGRERCHPRLGRNGHGNAGRLRNDGKPARIRRSACGLLSAPSAIRTRGLLLRSNPGPDGVATSDDAGQVGGGTHCCSPSYLVIAAGQAAKVTVQAEQAIVSGSGIQPLYRPWAITLITARRLPLTVRRDYSDEVAGP
jgi:hypothetical protein